MRPMRELTLNHEMQQRGLTLRDCCVLIYNHTGVAVDPRHIRTSLDRQGCLSNRDTAIFMLLFKLLGEGKGHGQAA